MKSLLLSSLLLLGVISVNAQNDLIIKCGGFLGYTCPKGYRKIITREGQNPRDCQCERDRTPEEQEIYFEKECPYNVEYCLKHYAQYCSKIEDTKCPAKYYVQVCDVNKYFSDDVCKQKRREYADEYNKEGKTESQLYKCESYKPSCLSGNNYACTICQINCDKRSLIELAEKGKISTGTKDFKAKFDAILKTTPEATPEATSEPVSPEEEELCNKYKASCQSTSKIGDCLNVASYCGNKVVADFCRKGLIKNSATCSYAYQNS